MKTVNRRALLKGAAGMAGAMGAAALTPVVEGAGAFAAGGGSAPARGSLAPRFLTPSTLLTYMAIPGYSFKPIYSTSTETWPGTYGAVSQSGGSPDFWTAPVAIPSGSFLVEAKMGVYMNDGTNSSACLLNNYDFTNAGGTNLASVVVTSPSNSIQVINFAFTPWAISPGEAITLGWQPGATTTAHRLVGGAIGYLPAGAVTMLSSPVRLIDTRGASPGAQYNLGGAFASGETRTYGPFTALPANVRTGLQGLVLNVGATGWNTSGYLTVWPAGATTPVASTLNFSTSAYAWANGTVVADGSGVNAGKISIYANLNPASGSSVDVFVDLVGIIA